MSNKTVYVPVDPEGFGCGLLLGLIIRYWRELLIAGALIFGCAFVVNIVTSITSAISASNAASAAATQSIIQSQTEESRKALLNNAFSNIRQFEGKIQLGNGNGIVADRGPDYGSVRVNAIEFSSTSINVYFDSYSTSWWGGSPPNGPQLSCILFKGIDPEHVGTPIGYEISPDKAWWSDPNSLISYTGYLSYSPTILSPDVSLLGNDTNLYFAYECGLDSKLIPMIDVLNFAK